MIVAVLLVALAAVVLVVISERRLNNRLGRQVNHYRKAYYEAKERADKAETDLAMARRTRKSQ